MKRSDDELLKERCGGKDATMKPVMLVEKEGTCYVVTVVQLLFICNARTFAFITYFPGLKIAVMLHTAVSKYTLCLEKN